VAQDGSVAPADPAIAPVTATGGEALRAGEQQFRQAFDRAPFGMALASLAADRLHSYLVVNDAFCQLTGYSRGELDGAGFLSDFHPDEQPALEGLIGEITAGRTDQIRADTRLIRKDGETVFVRLTGSAIRPPVGERYLAIFVEDAAAAEQARAEIGRLEQELQRSHRLESLGQLVGGIAHDFNNLLAVISNYASLVHEETSAAEATQSVTRWEPVRRDVEQIEDAADRAKRLIKHLLAFARPQAPRPVQLDPGQLISDVVRMLGQVLGDNIRLVTEPGAGLWPVVADPAQLEQVIINIAVNARDAMPTGGQVTIGTANVEIGNVGGTTRGHTATTGAAPGAATGAARTGPRLTNSGSASAKVTGLVRGVPDRRDATDLADLPPGRYVQLRISDTGIGMDVATAGHAFEPFFTTKSPDQAAGLGLSAVRRFVSRAGGKALLRSEPGRGTTVTLLLPAAPGSASVATWPAAERQAAQPDQASTVLVVDDEGAIRDVVHRVLSRAGYRVMTAAGRQEALDLLRNPGVPVDLLLTDVVMPGMTGQEFATQVQAVCPGIRVLFMSGYEQPGLMADGWPAPGTQILDKPFSRAGLLASVNQLLTAEHRAENG
jgi:PAS domain S-box-containing protein